MRFISFLLMLYFSLLSLAPNWQGIQLLNASAFIEHYEEYQAESKEATLSSFIQEHYFNKFADFDKEHKELPLKTTVQVAAIYFTEHFETPIPVVQTHEEVFVEQNQNNSKVISFIANDFHSIWHPPQLS
ncbi:MAG: hypothetical protein KA736_10305 [Crocinitomicaceae bacterium]|nr:hypothetical protein [Crocinitomicaceae bacterium]MBP6031814.1 hypothetical protein [Crocinitomicaceae bacterium]